MVAENKLPGDLGLGVIVGLIGAAGGFVVLSRLLWQIPYPTSLGNYQSHLAGWLAMEAYASLPFLLEQRGRAYLAYLHQLPVGLSPWMLTLRFQVAFFTATGLGLFICYLLAKSRSAERHVAGRRLFKGKKGLKILAGRATSFAKKFGVGLKIHPSFKWVLSLDQESRHSIVWGSTGSGKTQILIPWVEAAIARGDKLVIFDNKGDFTSWLPSPFILVAPWDSRSVAWDIAKDCQNQQDAQELAARLIAEGHDPLWHQSARQVLTAVIVKLQHEQPEMWTWASLYKLACSSQEDLLTVVKQFVPEARHLFESPGKTTQSVLINLGANLSIVGQLATAWGNAEPKRRFSFSQWLAADKSKHRVVVLQGSGRYADLARSYLQSALTLMSSRINSPDFIDSRKRKLWFFLDEFPQLGELTDFSPLLEIGRSKGVRVVIGVQDIAQIKNLYGEHTADSWTSMIGTQIVVRLNPGGTANTLATEVIGTRTVDRVVYHNNKREAPVREHPLVVDPVVISEQLGPSEKGVRALVLGFGDTFLVDWPYVNPPKLRNPSVPAAWLRLPKSTKGSSRGQAAKANAIATKPGADMSQPELASLILRAPTADELMAMAHAGSDLQAAAEDPVDLVTTASGGTHESQ